jgi:adenylate cyclase
MSGQFALSYRPKRPGLYSGLVSSIRNRWSLALAARTVARHGRNSRLLAAVHTDMVGYSRLFTLDDIGTVARLRALRRSLIAPTIRRHGGQLVQTAGDSMLITFDSVARAVRCAVTIQQALAIDNTIWPQDRQMHLRMGIDLGDVFAEGTDFHGDGVIVAARLQAMCPPGAVCISRAIHERAADRLGLAYETLGVLALKNFARPVEAFVLWPSRPEMEHPKLIECATNA